MKIQPTYLTLHYFPLYYFTSQLAHYDLALYYKNLARNKEAKQLVHKARAEEVWKSFRAQEQKLQKQKMTNNLPQGLRKQPRSSQCENRLPYM